MSTSQQRAIVVQIMDRFKVIHRDKKRPRKVSQPVNLPGITAPIPSVTVPNGEDDFSFGQQNKILQSEHKKCKHNMTVVKDLMDRSFTMHHSEGVLRCCRTL